MAYVKFPNVHVNWLLCCCRMTDSIVNKWLVVRYLVIGIYVGCVTVAGFAWWYMYFQVGLVYSLEVDNNYCVGKTS